MSHEIASSSKKLVGSCQHIMASLYVGNLHSNVNERMLFEKFSRFGNIVSIRVFKDKAQRSNGYAYVNYFHKKDAERALRSLNLYNLNGMPMRVMWYQRDPSSIKSNAGNIFIKNIDKYINDKDLHHLFSCFGTILSCKIARDENCRSKGYGYVNFENEKSANKAIEKTNGLILPSGKKLLVSKYLTYEERMKKELNKKFEMLNMSSCSDSSTDASSINKLNEASNKHKFIEVGKLEYEREIEEKLKELKIEQKNILFVRNLDHSVDDECLRNKFTSCGSVTYAKVIMENGRSKGFGFVCFSSKQDASKASKKIMKIGNKFVQVKRGDNDIINRWTYFELKMKQQAANSRLLSMHQCFPTSRNFSARNATVGRTQSMPFICPENLNKAMSSQTFFC